ncbi:MAG TPA: DUF3667 domain-containing protein [Longimicrobiaceae bacterium]|nr:DUF3667 domain-containing protein [Longimicrobiaceae bacterium]
MPPPTAGLATQACPQCGALGATRFCGECGHPLPAASAPPEDLRAFVRAGAAEALGLDRRLLATGRDLLLHPARVAAAHLAGRAGGYAHPLKLFFVLAGLYMLLLAWVQPFSFAAEVGDGGSLTRLVYGDGVELRRVFAAHGLTEEAAAARFQERANAAVPLATVLSLVPLAMILGVLRRGRPLRDHFTFLLVMANAVWLVSLLVLPVFMASRTVGVALLYAGMYLYLGIGFFAVYGGPSRAGTAVRFAACVASDFVLRTLVSALLTVAILATLFYP